MKRNRPGGTPVAGTEGEMSGEERIRILLRIAERVEVEGDSRLAKLFRRMADDARPLELELTPALGGVE